MNTDNTQLARQMFAAYPAGDRATVERILADDFRFTSPYDDAIDRDEYFRRCWPNHTSMRAINVQHVVEIDDGSVFVAYELVTKDDRHIRNVEVLRFRGGKLAEVFVHFGAVRGGDGTFIAMKPPG